MQGKRLKGGLLGGLGAFLGRRQGSDASTVHETCQVNASGIDISATIDGSLQSTAMSGIAASTDGSPASIPSSV